MPNFAVKVKFKNTNTPVQQEYGVTSIETAKKEIKAAIEKYNATCSLRIGCAEIEFIEILHEIK